MLSGVAKFTTIITIKVVSGEYIEAVRDTFDNSSLGVGQQTKNTITILDSKPAVVVWWWWGFGEVVVDGSEVAEEDNKFQRRSDSSHV